MNKLLISISLLISINILSKANTYSIDSSHTRIGFKVKHMGIIPVSGKFRKVIGSTMFDSKTKKFSKMNVTIDAKSIFTDDTDRDKHLTTADFFNVAKFNDITFKAKSFKYEGTTLVQIVGDLTIRNTTKEIKLRIEWGGVAIDPWGNEKMAFEAFGKIDRTKFGLTWNKGVKGVLGGMVGNDVKLILAIEANKK